MTFLASLVGLVVVLGLVLLILAFLLFQRRFGNSSQLEVFKQLAAQTEALRQDLSAQFAAATVDTAARLEQTKGAIGLQVADRLGDGFTGVRSAVEEQMKAGRREQAERLTEVRTELTASLALTTSQLKCEFDRLSQKTAQSLDAIRDRVDARLLAITDQVQQKLDQNIKEGFAHFAKVQEHLKAAEEQLRNVGTLGNSIHDLNNLLKLPHLRGKFGEASLERLLADFLPAHMFELQAGPEGSAGRADAMINFPERRMPIDAKFPREQVLALFQQESASDAELAEARKNFERVMKDQAKRIRGYIQPENGTTDFALMYLPSETLYMEAVRNHDLSDELNRMKVFPVSPNTLMVTLNAVAMVHKWYKLREGLAESVKQFEKAKKSFTSFESKFEVIGKSLERAQEAYSSAGKHLTQYKTRVLQVDEIPELPFENGSEALAEAMEKKALAERAEAAGRS